MFTPDVDRIRELRGTETLVSLAQRCGYKKSILSVMQRGGDVGIAVFIAVAAALRTTVPDIVLNSDELPDAYRPSGGELVQIREPVPA